MISVRKENDFILKTMKIQFKIMHFLKNEFMNQELAEKCFVDGRGKEKNVGHGDYFQFQMPLIKYRWFEVRGIDGGGNGVRVRDFSLLSFPFFSRQ